MIVEKVEMPARQPIDLRERIIHPLRVEAATTFEERVLVTKVAMLRTAAGDDDRVRDQIRAATNQITPDRRDAIERATSGRDIAPKRLPLSKVLEKARKGVLRRTKNDRIRVDRCF